MSETVDYGLMVNSSWALHENGWERVAGAHVPILERAGVPLRKGSCRRMGQPKDAQWAWYTPTWAIAALLATTQQATTPRTYKGPGKTIVRTKTMPRSRRIRLFSFLVGHPEELACWQATVMFCHRDTKLLREYLEDLADQAQQAEWGSL